MLTLFMRGVMCNWMVSTGVVAAMMSTSVSARSSPCGCPSCVLLHGLRALHRQHVPVPSGLMLGGNFTLMDYFWNEIPTVLGNLVGGLTLGATLYATHYKTAPKRALA
jgi:formate/nitrite transporter FocA (FNT family)